jgi:hypothetical protein
MSNIYLVESDITFWNQIFGIINNSTALKFIDYNYKFYFNCQNLWYNPHKNIKNNKQQFLAHENYKCIGTNECTCLNNINKIDVNINEITYYYDFNIDPDYIDEYNNQFNKIIKELFVFFEDIYAEPIKIKFFSKKNIIIRNISGFHNGHQGSNHTVLKLPFKTEQNIGKNFTLNDLIVTNIDLKSHKFDNWFESFNKCNIIENDNEIIIELIFNHKYE